MDRKKLKKSLTNRLWRGKMLWVMILLGVLLCSLSPAGNWYNPYFTSHINVTTPAVTSTPIVLTSIEKYGLNITANRQVGLINISVADSRMTGTTGYLYSGNDSLLLDTCSFVGYDCIFNYRNLTAGIPYYLLVGSSNATWGGLEATDMVYTITDGNINITDGASRNTLTSIFTGSGGSKYWNVLSITTGDLVANGYGVDIISETYSSVTYPLYNENFIINFTYNSSHYTSASANLIYANISYSGTLAGSGDNIRFIKTLVIPSVASSIINPFYWQILLTNSTGINEYNYTHHNQTITNIGFGLCSSTSVTVLNYTLRDEETQNKINGTQNNATIEVSIQAYNLDGLTIAANFSTNFTGENVENATICAISGFLNSSQYKLYADVRYYADGYYSQFNYIQNYTVNDTTIPKNINLYDLKISSSTFQFKITFKDENNNFIQGAIIDISKKYTWQGVYKSVKMTKTGSQGQSSAPLETDGIEYTFTITKNGKLLGIFENIPIICEDIISQTCNIKLYASLATSQMFDFITYQNLLYSISDFNETTRAVIVIFSTLDGSTSTVQLNLTKFDNYGNYSICSTYITSSSGTITCVIPASEGNLTIVGMLYKDSSLVHHWIFTIGAKVKDILGNNAFFFVFMIFIIFPIMLLSSPVGALIAGIIGFGLNIVLFGISKTFMGLGSFIGLFTLVVFIIIIKFYQRRDD